MYTERVKLITIFDSHIMSRYGYTILNYRLWLPQFGKWCIIILSWCD